MAVEWDIGGVEEDKKQTVSNPPDLALLCCPFCGGKGELDISGDDGISYSVGRAFVECSDCEACAEIFYNNKCYDKELSEKCEQDAINAWNKRAS